MHAFDAAAVRLIELEDASLPDLSAVTVIVPHHHVAEAFLDALRGHLDHPVFLAPRLVTLPKLAEDSQGAAETMSRGERVSRLHGMLRGLGWVADSALWPMANELHDLSDELDAAMLNPPASAGIVEAMVGAHARRQRGVPLSREAELVHRVWLALHRGPAGPIRDYAIRLADWAATHSQRVYLCGLRGLSRLESRFLALCAETRPVFDLPLLDAHPGRAEALRLLWPGDDNPPPLRARAQQCRQALPESPFIGRLSLCGADDLESEARMAAHWLKRQIAGGRCRIGVVALDRLAARRLRAILERDAILMRDETGWTFTTASASHVVDRLCALVEDRFYFRDVLDLLKSEHLFPDMQASRRDVEVTTFERALHENSVIRDQAAMLRLARDAHLPLVAAMLDRLGLACRTLATRQARPLAEWQDTLLHALVALGAGAAWRGDAIGGQLHRHLKRLRGELAHDTTRYDFDQWRAWLDGELERATFRDQEIDSPIRLTHLGAARLRGFEAVALLGADHAHLPPTSRGGPLSEAARREIGLPDSRRERDQARAALIDILVDTDEILIAWQARRDGEPNSPSPWLETLDAFHRQAWGTSLTLAADGPVEAPGHLAPCAHDGRPMPSLDALPDRLSASAWQRLIECPYRYFARDALGLGEPEEAIEAMEKRHYGALAHRILARFHADHPCLAETSRDSLLAHLEMISDTVFAEASIGDYLTRAWHHRWRAHLPLYLDWALRREAEGFRWRSAETRLERPLDLGAAGQVNLYGRLDRLDEGPEGRVVIDYKVQSLQTLRNKLKRPGEDVQLAFYCLLADAGRAEYVSLDDTRVDGIPLADQALVAAEAERLRATLTALAKGAPMPAHGAAPICARCEMEGLCRRGHWPDPA